MSEIKRKCKLCQKTLVSIGLSRENGKKIIKIGTQENIIKNVGKLKKIKVGLIN